jgi:predicted dehydrogenase
MVRYAIVGTGRMGNAHASQLSHIEHTEIAGSYDLIPERALEFQKKYGGQVCNSLQELVALPNLDCLIITTPTYCHAEAIYAAKAAGLNIFCEKPLCRQPKEAEELLAAMKDYPRLFTVGFVRRHMSKTLKARQIIASGQLGRLRYCNVDLPLGGYRRMPGDWFADFDKCGGATLDMLAHHVDLCNWFFGKPIRVSASSMMLDPSLPLPADYVASIVNYDSGVICNLMSSWQRFGRSNEMMEIYGEKGALVIDGSDALTVYHADGSKESIDSTLDFPAPKVVGQGVNEVNAASGLFRQAQNLTHALSGQKVALPKMLDASTSVKVGLSMIESAQTGKTVVL